MVARTFCISTEPVTGAIVLQGDLDLAAVKTLERGVRPAVEHGGPVTLDATELSFMDSTGIRLLIHIARRLDGRGCLIIHGLSDSIRKVIDLVGLEGSMENLQFIPHKRPLPDEADR